MRKKIVAGGRRSPVKITNKILASHPRARGRSQDFSISTGGGTRLSSSHTLNGRILELMRQRDAEIRALDLDEDIDPSERDVAIQETGEYYARRINDEAENQELRPLVPEVNVGLEVADESPDTATIRPAVAQAEEFFNSEVQFEADEVTSQTRRMMSRSAWVGMYIRTNATMRMVMVREDNRNAPSMGEISNYFRNHEESSTTTEEGEEYFPPVAGETNT